jgi:hypothetical protein
MQQGHMTKEIAAGPPTGMKPAKVDNMIKEIAAKVDNMIKKAIKAKGDKMIKAIKAKVDNMIKEEQANATSHHISSRHIISHKIAVTTAIINVT